MSVKNRLNVLLHVVCNNTIYFSNNLNINKMIKIKNVKMIEVRDWDKLVEETYGRIYSFQQQDGCKERGVVNISIPDEFDDEEMNDTIPEVINHESKMGVKFNVWLNRDPKEPLNPSKEELKECNYYWEESEEDEMTWKQNINNINMFWERNFYPNVQMVANDLHKKGLLEAGEYSINIDW